MFNLKLKNKHGYYKKGMTYVELIVVLSIFATMSSVLIFNYGAFQEKVDIKNLASDIALKLVQAQKESLNGKLPPFAQQTLITNNGSIDAWKPSYGVYFDTSNTNTKKSFIYFADVNDDSVCDLTCDNAMTSGNTSGGEFMEKIDINKGNYIKDIIAFGAGGVCPIAGGIEKLNISYKRPNSGAIINTVPDLLTCGTLDHLEINIVSRSLSASSKILVYPSGRIQIK